MGTCKSYAKLQYLCVVLFIIMMTLQTLWPLLILTITVLLHLLFSSDKKLHGIENVFSFHPLNAINSQHYIFNVGQDVRCSSSPPKGTLWPFNLNIPSSIKRKVVKPSINWPKKEELSDIGTLINELDALFRKINSHIYFKFIICKIHALLDKLLFLKLQ